MNLVAIRVGIPNEVQWRNGGVQRFKTPVLLVAAFLCSVAAASPRDTVVRAVRYHQDVTVAAPEALAARLVALLNSCSGNSTAYAMSGDTRAGMLASSSFIHVVFMEPRRARPMSDGDGTQAPRIIGEILLPLPEDKWPAHVLVKSEGKTLAFTKYDPLALRDIVLVRELRLQTVRPYDSLLHLPDRQSLLRVPVLIGTWKYAASAWLGGARR